MGLGAVFEVAIRVVRRHVAVLLPLALLFIGPGALLTAATGVRFNEVALDILQVGPDGEVPAPPELLTEAELERVGGALVAFLLATALAGALATVGALGFSAVVGADYHGRTVTFGAALRTSLRGTLAALGVVLVTSLITIAILVTGTALIVLALVLVAGGRVDAGGPGAFLALVVGVATVFSIVYLTMRWAMAVPAIALEGEGPRGALRRSWDLTTEHVWRTLAVILLGSLATAILSTLVAQVLALVVVDALAAPLGLDTLIAESLVVAVGAVLLAPVVPVVVAVLYHDLRVRRDAWEPGLDP